jgi:hypothetical protein
MPGDGDVFQGLPDGAVVGQTCAREHERIDSLVLACQRGLRHEATVERAYVGEPLHPFMVQDGIVQDGIVQDGIETSYELTTCSHRWMVGSHDGLVSSQSFQEREPEHRGAGHR